MKHTQPTTSSVYIDDLVNAYLPRAGRRRFEWVDLAALKQCAHQALYAVVKTYGLRNLSEAEFWDNIGRGSPYDHMRLLPDDATAREAAAASEDVIVYLNGIKNPKALLRRTYFNTVLREECLPENAQKKIKNEALCSSAPAQRKSNTKGGHSSLQSQSEAAGERCSALSASMVETAVKKVLSKMRPRHAQVITLLLSGVRKADVAEKMKMTVPNVFAINSKFRLACQKAVAILEKQQR